MAKISNENKVVVAGVGMIPFAKPGDSKSYDLMGSEATKLALEDCGLNYKSIRSKC